MEAERWRRVETLFHRAVELSPGERGSWLAAQCGGDDALRAEVERLIDFDAPGAPTGGASTSDAFSRLEAHTREVRDPLLGRVLGAWRLVSRIAAGGMGVVYLGERADGLFQQQVAIKLVRAERASEWMLRRFEFERRTLAELSHPCIARLVDAGSTEDGWPYFVMEFVQGERIDQHCERRRLPIEARLRLFVEVCRAVQFAHGKLVVHCDLKPANVLIDERGVPRLLDFGIARFLESEPPEPGGPGPRTLTRALTPEYASPEQLAGEGVSTSMDVYSLGVVLYELLTGERPFHGDGSTAAELERRIREESPERPSTRALRLSDAAHDDARRPDTAEPRARPAGPVRALRGDLDRIVLMALRKEPERRYASVQDFADDVERHLHGLPVRARDNSVVYLGAKFVGRPRVAVAAAVLVLASLIFGLVSAQRAERAAAAEALHARMEAESFQSLGDFLMDAFLPGQPSADPAWQSEARERILAHAERVRRQYADDEHQRANLFDALGRVCARLDLLEEAAELVGLAADLRRNAFGEHSAEYALSLRSGGQLAYQAGDFAEAAQMLESALAIHRGEPSSQGPEIAGLANDLAACLRRLGRLEEAERLHGEALELRRAGGPRTLPVAESLNNLALVHIGRADTGLAVEELREALSIREEILGAAHPLSVQVLSNLSGALWRQGAREESLKILGRAEAGYRSLGGDGEAELAVALSNHAAMQLELGDAAGAELNLLEALTLHRRRLGEHHPQVSETLARLAALNHRRGRDEEARAQWEEVLRLRREEASLPLALAEAQYGYAVFLCDLGELEPAGDLAREALEIFRAAELPDGASLGRALYVLGRCLLLGGDRAAAVEHFREAVRLLETSPSASAEERARVGRDLRSLEASPRG